MTQKKIITVVGATGSQGGSLARAILAESDGVFAVRAVTRHPGSDRAKELEQLGADVVQADMDDQASLGPAFEGAYGAYLVTNFWEHMSAEREKAQAAALATAAGHAGIQHGIWSTLEDTRECIPLDDDRMPTLQGRYKVPHFDGKAESDHCFPDAGIPTTFLRTTFYWENLLGPVAPRRGENGVLELSLPMGTSRLSGIAAEDIGRTALEIFKRGPDLIGAMVSIAGEHLTVTDMAKSMTEVLGEPVQYLPMTPDAYRQLDFPGADEMGNMFQYYVECEDRFTRARDLAEVRQLNPDVQDFATWLDTHQDQLRAALSA
jgi:uncharacterized protein YbjT (DUF2867 family)